MKRSILIALALCLSGSLSFAQGIVNAELNTAPMAVNPAFTGMFNGCVRVNTFYSSRWEDAMVPFVSMGVSADMPVYTNKKGNYLAAGLQLHKDMAGDGNLSNFNSILSVSYHKIFRKSNDSNNSHSSDLAIGVEAGYDQCSIDVGQIYFGNFWYLSYPYYNYNYYLPPPGQSIQYNLGIGNDISYYPVNVGICFSQAAGPKFNYTVGVAVYNLSQPKTAYEQFQYNYAGLQRSCIAEIGAVWKITSRLTLKPEILYQSIPSVWNFIAGNDFEYNVSKHPALPNTTSVFAGAWLRTGDLLMATAGVAFKRLRIGIAYDYHVMPVSIPGDRNEGFIINRYQFY